MPDNQQHEVPILVKPKPDPFGTVNGLGGFVANFRRAFGFITAHPWIVAVTVFYKAARAALTAWGKEEQAQNELGQALVNSGLYTRAREKAYREMAVAVERKTTFTNDEVMAAQATLLPLRQGREVSERLLMSVANFAKVNRMGLAEAANLIGRAIETDVNALSRYGVELDATLSPREKEVRVLAALEARYAGQAEAATQGLGALTLMQNALTRILERIGQGLAPFAEQAARAVTRLATSLTESNRFLDMVSGLFLTFALAREAAEAFLTFAIETTKNQFGTIGGVVGSLVRGDVRGMMENFQLGLEQQFRIVETTRREFVADAIEVLEVAAKDRKKSDDRMWQSAANKARGKRRAQGQTKEERNRFWKTKSNKEIAQDLAHTRNKENLLLAWYTQELQTEKDVTRRAKLESEKRDLLERETEKAERDLNIAEKKIGHFFNTAELDTEMKVIEALGELKNSRAAPLVILGRNLSVFSIAYNTATHAIPGTVQICEKIPPPVGPVLAIAMSAFLAAYSVEQIANIATSDIDHPGTIGGSVKPADLDSIELLAQAAYRYAVSTNENTLGSFAAALEALLGTSFGKEIGETLRTSGRVLDYLYYGLYIDIAKGIGGWIGIKFAEGGVVSGGQVEPLPSGGMARKITVVVDGGIVPSARSARRLAAQIVKEVRNV